MDNDINNLPTFKELEQDLFQELQKVYQSALISILEEIDLWLMNHRDFSRFKNREMQEFTINTMFGSITMKRRIYLDREKGGRVALLDRYLKFSGSDGLSPFLTEMAVKWAVKGPSYRDARDRFNDLLGYQVMSHEGIRQKVLGIEEKTTKSFTNLQKKKDIDVLFLEVDGLHAHKQNSKRSTREVKIGIAHEGWGTRHPSSDEYVLQHKSYWHTLGTGDEFWEDFSRYLYNKYCITENTYVIINGDGAPWIRSGVDYFENALYVYDYYHAKKWIKTALRNRTKQERRKAYVAVDERKPTELLVALAEAEKNETDEEVKEEIEAFRLFVFDNQHAFLDYRDILKEKGIDVSGMRTMGAAESNMNLFSRRLKKYGYSWSFDGLNKMAGAMIHRFEGNLIKAIQTFHSETIDDRKDKNLAKYPSFASLLTEKTRQSIGAINGHLPALVGDDHGKPYVRALRGLVGF